MTERWCVVCGERAAGRTGYMFYADGRSRTGIPLCKAHLDRNDEFSNPAFENSAALDLFRKLHPRLYAKRVKSKRIIYFPMGEAVRKIVQETLKET